MTENLIRKWLTCRLMTFKTSHVLMPMMGLFLVGLSAQAQTKPTTTKKHMLHTEMTMAISVGEPPSGYQQVGTTDLCYIQKGTSIDIKGYYNGSWYRSTYSDNGYYAAISVKLMGSDDIFNDICGDGYTYNGVKFTSYVEQQGDLARMCYSLTNTNDIDALISLGAYADVMIGGNDSAPISLRKDQLDNTYGLTMKDGQGAQLCVLFGAGLAGVTKVDDFWFGRYGYNASAYQIIGNYENAEYYMVENGSYDSAMGWCWKDRTIAAGATITFSYLIGVGEVNLEPNSSFEVTPEDPDGWNDLSLPHKLTLNGEYESPAGIDGMIEYAVEDSEQWSALTDTLASGDKFTADLVVMFDTNKEIHKINFRTVDAVGNTTLLTPITYQDVYFQKLTGIVDKEYNYGDSIYQDNIACELSKEHYVINDYQNNVNVGTATFKIQGVFPETIGRRSYSFNITPLALEGEIALIDSLYIYDSTAKQPNWEFTSARNKDLVKDTDYTIAYKNAIYPGEGTVEVSGIGNFTGSLTSTFTIDKAPLTAEQYTLILPDSDISYDGESHAVTYTKEEGVGEISISYIDTATNTETAEAPSAVGIYDIYAAISEGAYYYGLDKEKIGSFTIYQFDENEWLTLNALTAQLLECGWTAPWNLAAGPVAVSTFEGLTIEQGHVVGVDFSSKGLTTIPTGLVALTQLKSLNLSHNNLTGNIGLLAAQMRGLISLDVSYNQFSDVFPMISTNVTALDISHQTIDRTIDFDISNLDTEKIAAQIPTIVLYDHVNQVFNTDLNFICTTSEAAEFDNSDTEQFAIQLMLKNGVLMMPYVSTNNIYRGNNGDTFKVFALDGEGNHTGSNLHLNFYFNQGDANFNGKTDILDIQSIINFMFDEYIPKLPFNYTAANLWDDECINIQDAVCGVELLLSQNSAMSKPKKVAPSDNQLGYEAFSNKAIVSIHDGKITVNSDIPIAAFDLCIESDTELAVNEELKSLGFMISQRYSNGIIRLIGYSFNGATIPCYEFTICEGVEDSHSNVIAMFSDREAYEIPSYMQSDTTSISRISADDLYDAEVYTLQGIRIPAQNVTKGSAYIIKRNYHSTKVLITE